jgi:hypothetical protein
VGSTGVRSTIVGGGTASEISIIVEDGIAVRDGTLNVVSRRASTVTLVGERSRVTHTAGEALGVATVGLALVNGIVENVRGEATREAGGSHESTVTGKVEGDGAGSSTELQILTFADTLVEIGRDGEALASRFVATNDITERNNTTSREVGETIPHVFEKVAGRFPETTVKHALVDVHAHAVGDIGVLGVPSLLVLGNVRANVDVHLDLVVLLLEDLPSLREGEITAISIHEAWHAIVQVQIDSIVAISEFGGQESHEVIENPVDSLIRGGRLEGDADGDAVVVGGDCFVQGSIHVLSVDKVGVQIESVVAKNGSLGVKESADGVEKVPCQNVRNESILVEGEEGVIDHSSVVTHASVVARNHTVDASRHLTAVDKLTGLAVVGNAIGVHVAGIGEAHAAVASIGDTILIGVQTVVVGGGADVAVVGDAVEIGIHVVGGKVKGLELERVVLSIPALMTRTVPPVVVGVQIVVTITLEGCPHVVGEGTRIGAGTVAVGIVSLSVPQSFDRKIGEFRFSVFGPGGGTSIPEIVVHGDKVSIIGRGVIVPDQARIRRGREDSGILSIAIEIVVLSLGKSFLPVFIEYTSDIKVAHTNTPISFVGRIQTTVLVNEFEIRFEISDRGDVVGAPHPRTGTGQLNIKNVRNANRYKIIKTRIPALGNVRQSASTEIILCAELIVRLRGVSQRKLELCAQIGRNRIHRIVFGCGRVRSSPIRAVVESAPLGDISEVCASTTKVWTIDYSTRVHVDGRTGHTIEAGFGQFTKRTIAKFAIQSVI